MDKSITMKLIWVLFAYLGVATCGTTLTLLLRQKELLSVFYSIDSLDIALGKYGIEANYYSECKTLYTINLIQVIFMPMYDVIIENYRSRTPTHHASENIMFGISIPIRIYMFILMTMIYKSLNIKMSSINKILVKMGCYDKAFDTSDNERDNYEGCDDEQTQEMFKDLTYLHGKVCEVANRLNIVLQPFLLLHIGVNLLTLVVAMVVFITLDERMKPYEYVFHALLFSSQLVYLLRYTQKLAKEVS